MALFTIVFYSFFYTLILKPALRRNIVIGVSPVLWRADRMGCHERTVAAPVGHVRGHLFLDTKHSGRWHISKAIRKSEVRFTVLKGDKEPAIISVKITLGSTRIAAAETCRFGWIYSRLAGRWVYVLPLGWRMWRRSDNVLAGIVRLFICLLWCLLALMVDGGIRG